MKLEQQLLENQVLPLAASSDLVVQEFKDEILIYNLKTNRAFCLNETSAAVWQACDGSRSVLEIAEEVSQKLNSFVSEDIVWLALEQLKKDNLLVGCEDLLIDFGGMSRREVIRKAGLATVIALPVVSALIAPAPAQAASGNPNGACTDNCAITGLTCSCPVGSITCAPGRTVSATVGLGLCVNASVAASVIGVNVGAGLNGNVCLIATACIL